jgi:diacylglycerol kinase family enzyme
LLLNLLKQVFTGKSRKIESSLNLPVIYFQSSELIVENEDAAPLHIDGDPAATPDRLHIRILPQCFRLIHPR